MAKVILLDEIEGVLVHPKGVPYLTTVFKNSRSRFLKTGGNSVELDLSQTREIMGESWHLVRLIDSNMSGNALVKTRSVFLRRLKNKSLSDPESLWILAFKGETYLRMGSVFTRSEYDKIRGL